MTIGLRFAILALAAGLLSGTVGCAAAGETALPAPLPGQGSYRDGERDGPWRFYYADGALLAEGEFSRGRPCGEWSYWYEDGSPFLCGRRDPLPTGEWYQWTRDGRLSEDRGGMSCDGSALVIRMAGFGDFDATREAEWSRESRGLLFGWSWFSWDGPGMYAEGERLAELSAGGLRRAEQARREMLEHARALLPRPP